MQPVSSFDSPGARLAPGGLILLVIAGIGGCAAQTPDLTKLTKRLEEIAQREEQHQRQLDELNNRLFLLEDRVDTSRVALERRGGGVRMPVIRIPSGAEPEEGQAPGGQVAQPAPLDEAAEEGAPQEDTAGEEPEDEDAPSGSLVAADPVDYAGEAAEDKPRPVLRLHGSPAAAAGRPAVTGRCSR